MSREEKIIELKAQVAYYLTRSGYNKKYLAIKIGMCPAGFYNKLNNPEKFTLKEFNSLCRIMGLTDQKKMEIM